MYVLSLEFARVARGVSTPNRFDSLGRDLMDHYQSCCLVREEGAMP